MTPPDTQHPYLVGVIQTGDDGFYHRCDAALVAPDLVLAAKYCARDATFIHTTTLDTMENLYPVVEIIECADTFCDLAMIRLETAAENARPIEIKDYALSYGNTISSLSLDLTQPLEHAPHAVELKVRGTYSCKRRFGYVSPTHFCAYGKIRNTCQGEKAGPIILKKDEGEFLVGFAQGGDACNSRDPGLFSKLSSPVLQNFVNGILAGGPAPVSQHWVACGQLDACDNPRIPGMESHERQRAVRCCSDSFVNGFEQKFGCETYGTSKLGGTCHSHKSFQEAMDICEGENGRLCTREEMEADCTRNTGCGFNDNLIWTSSIEVNA